MNFTHSVVRTPGSHDGTEPFRWAGRGGARLWRSKDEHKSCYNSCYSVVPACYNFLNRVTTRVTVLFRRVTAF